MATAADTPPIPGLPSAHMHMRTCNICRQRRVKCDRQVPQCSNCLRYEATCFYPPGRGRAPRRPRRGMAQLTEGLSRLEGIINELGAAAQGNHQDQETFKAQEDSFDQSFSRLKVDESKSYYVNNALWVTLSNEVEELRDLLFQPASEDADDELAPSPYPSHSSPTITATTSPSSLLGLNAIMFGYRAIAASLHDFHPSLPQAMTLFASFTDNVAPLVRIFHMPALTRVYWDAIASPDPADKHTEALIFAIHYSAVVSLSPEQCLIIFDETRDVVLERYRFAIEQALARGKLLNTQNMRMLQAAVLFLSALPNEDDSRAAWSLTSLIYHIARTMGLHRDGTAFGLDPFETELRRRLWWQICIIDSRSSEHHCNESIARGFSSDTKPPLHVNDADLWPGMAEPPAERWDQATDMTLSLVRCEAIQTDWELGRIKHKSYSQPTSSRTVPADDSRETHKKRQALIQNLESRLRGKYLPICNSSVPFQFLSSAVARIIIARFWLVTQYSLVSYEKQADDKNKSGLNPAVPDSTDRMEHDMRDELFRNSIEILEVSGMLLTNKDILQWTWYAKTHIQWGAMAFVLSELCTRPHSHECDRAWNYVTIVYDGWKVGGNQDEKGHLALWRPVKRLMAKARYLREIQRIDPGRPASHGRRVQRHDTGSYSTTLGLLSHHHLTTHASFCYSLSSQTLGSVPRPGSSFSESSVIRSKEPSDAIQGVLGTGTLGALMDFSSDWSWENDDGDIASSLAGLDFELPPFLI